MFMNFTFIFPIFLFIGFSKIFAFKDSNQSLVLSNDYRINGVAIQNAFIFHLQVLKQCYFSSVRYCANYKRGHGY